MDVSALRRRIARMAALFSLVSVAGVGAQAQTVQLADSNATTIRGGTYADSTAGYAVLLETRTSTDASYLRRALLKFDTQNTIPQGTAIASATLTLTVAGGNSEVRQLGAYRIAASYEELQATWNRRNSATSWSSPGGDLADQYAVASVGSVPGTKVSFDLTALVQAAVKGTFGSRYTRVALVDAGAASSGSYKQFYSNDAADPNVRPVLTVVTGDGAGTPEPEPDPTPDPTPSSVVTLRVLQWNLHHGVGTDGKYNLDRIATWMAKMRPDVVMLNEVEKYTSWGNEDQPARYKALLEQKTGRKWYAHFAQEFGNWTGAGKGHLTLSVYPFDSTDHARITPSDGLKGAGAVAMSRITVNGRTLTFVVTHLDPYSQTMRLTQAKDTIRWAAGFAENRIIGGDMNAWPDQSSIAEFNRTYADSWTVAASKGQAISFPGLSPLGATKKGRIDYIFYSKTAPNLVVKQSQVYDTRDASGYMPSDHRPVVTTFEVR